MKFSIKESLKFGWEITKSNFWFLVGVLAISFLVSIVTNILQQSVIALTKQSLFLFGVAAVAIFVASMIAQLVINLGLLKIAINFADGVKSDFKELFSQYKVIWRFLGASILYGLIVLGGLILLVVPGIIWAIKFQFYQYFIVDKNSGIKESLRLSAQATQGVKWQLFLFVLSIILLNVLGALALMVGLLVTIPVTMVAIAYVYRKLSSQMEIPATSAVEPAKV